MSGSSESKKPPDNKYFIVLDWDDTIFPAFYFSQKVNKYICVNYKYNGVLTFEEEKMIKELEKEVIKFFEHLLKYGNINIISNSEEGWVIQSMVAFFPLLWNYVSCKLKKQINIYHTLAKMKCPNKINPTFAQPKFRTLVNIFNNFMRDKMSPDGTEVISFGDSVIDQHTIWSLRYLKKDLCIKNFKLVDMPNIQDLLNQISLINNTLTNVFIHLGSLDLQMSINRIVIKDSESIKKESDKCCGSSIDKIKS